MIGVKKDAEQLFAAYCAGGIDCGNVCRSFVLWNDFWSMEAEFNVIIVHFIDFEGG